MGKNCDSVTILTENLVKKLGFRRILGIKFCGYPSYSFFIRSIFYLGEWFTRILPGGRKGEKIHFEACLYEVIRLFGG